MQLKITILLFFFHLGIVGIGFSQKHIIVDADTGNEVDDLYDLARIFTEEDLKVTALNAAHWQTSHWAIPNTMENSHRLNQQLLGEMGLDIKTFRGGTQRMYDWGDRAQHSAASYEIIRQAEANDTMTILALGALTNVASAIFIEPEIAPKLKVYWLGATMDFETKVLKRTTFNALMDPYALDVLLDSEVDFHILPNNVAAAMNVDFVVMEGQIGNHFLGKYLQKRWRDHLDGGRRSRVLWDLALVAIYLHPEWAQVERIKTSRDNGNRRITFYKNLNVDAIYQDFYQTLLAFEKE